MPAFDRLRFFVQTVRERASGPLHARPMPPTAPARGSAAEVFAAFLRLGLTAFGGPVAHLAHFRDEFVVRRGWLDERAWADLVALCQFLPGPASSQAGFALGLMRAGWAGALAAFAAFTLPSAAIMLALAQGASSLTGPAAAGAVAGLKLAAAAVVAQAVWGMAGALTPDRVRLTLAVAAVAAVALVPAPWAMPGAILAGALAGLALRLEPGGAAGDAAGRAAPAMPVGRGAALAALALALALLAGLPLLAGLGPAWALADGFYRAGALVFGGGHVVLPLLQAETVAPGLVAPEAFLTGYAAAQALPGPLFAFGAWLGALAQPGPGGAAGAALALAALFLPGFLLLVAALPFWARLRAAPRARAALAGANAAVVGILAAALYDPVFTTGVAGPAGFACALALAVGLIGWRLPAWAAVAAAGAGGALLGAAGALG